MSETGRPPKGRQVDRGVFNGGYLLQAPELGVTEQGPEGGLLTPLSSTLMSAAQIMKEGSTSDYVSLTKCQRNENKWLNVPWGDEEFSY